MKITLGSIIGILIVAGIAVAVNGDLLQGRLSRNTRILPAYDETKNTSDNDLVRESVRLINENNRSKNLNWTAKETKVYELFINKEFKPEPIKIPAAYADLDKYFEYSQLYQNMMPDDLLEDDDYLDIAIEEGYNIPADYLPSEFSWANYKNKNYLTSIKDQGDCQLCWGFSINATMEAMYKIKTSNEIDLSEQEFLECCEECDVNDSSKLCHTADPALAAEYVEENGMSLESVYPFNPNKTEWSCTAYGNKTKMWINEWQYVTKKDGYHIDNGTSYYEEPVTEDDMVLMKQAVIHGPIEVVLNTGEGYWAYGGGIYEEPGCCDVGIDHSVLLIGWDDNKQAWRIKNHSGTDWGENGLGWVKYNSHNLGRQSVRLEGVTLKEWDKNNGWVTVQ